MAFLRKRGPWAYGKKIQTTRARTNRPSEKRVEKHSHTFDVEDCHLAFTSPSPAAAGLRGLLLQMEAPLAIRKDDLRKSEIRTATKSEIRTESTTCATHAQGSLTHTCLMRSACGQVRRRPRQWLHASAATPSFQYAPSSGLTGLSLAEVWTHLKT